MDAPGVLGMINRKLVIRALVATVAVAINIISWGSLSAAVISEFGVDEGTEDAFVIANQAYGVKVTTSGTGPWNNITFNYFKDADNTAYAEDGVSLYVLTEEYNDLAGDLSDLIDVDDSYVMHTDSVVGNKWVFTPSDQLDSGTYYIYMDDASDVALDAGLIASEEYFFAANGATGNYTDGNVGTFVAYSLDGEAVSSEPIPEPASLLIGGIAGIGMAWSAVRRRRRQAAAESSENPSGTAV